MSWIRLNVRVLPFLYLWLLCCVYISKNRAQNHCPIHLNIVRLYLYKPHRYSDETTRNIGKIFIIRFAIHIHTQYTVRHRETHGKAGKVVYGTIKWCLYGLFLNDNNKLNALRHFFFFYNIFTFLW